MSLAHRGVHAAAAAACVTLLLSGCGTATDSTPSQSGVNTTTGAAPANSALKSVDQQSFQAVVDAAAKAVKVPGAMVVLRTPQGTFNAAFGTTELGKEIPPTADTHYRIGSNTKTMTAAVVVLLAQDGKLKFTDPVADYVPGVPNGENITIADLLTMRSGLYNFTADPALSAALDADPAKAFTPQEMLALAFKRPPNAAPNTEYEYNNTNFVLLGLVAEKVGGSPLVTQFQDRLWGPLGLTKTSLPAIEDTAMPAPYSHGYLFGGTYSALGDDPYPPDIQAGAENGTLKPNDDTNQNSSYAYASGGAISTAADVATWIDALVAGKVFDAEYQRQWLASLQPLDPAAPDGQKYGYGIAFQRVGPNANIYYHGGELPGFNSFMGHDPDNDVTIVVWTNLTRSPDGKTTANAMMPALLNAIYKDIPPPPAATPTPTTTR